MPVFFADLLREMILTFQNECIQIIVPVLMQAHSSFQETCIPGLNFFLIYVFYICQGGYVFAGFCLSVCVYKITQKVMDGSF